MHRTVPSPTPTQSSSHSHTNSISVPASSPIHHNSHYSHAPLRSALKHTSRPSSPQNNKSSSHTTDSTPPTLRPTLGFSVTSPPALSDSPSSSTPTNGSMESPSKLGSRPLHLNSPANTDVVSPPAYTPKVGFDTFENPAAAMFSFTLQTKSAGYRRTRSTRVFLCAASADESGREALEWALEALVREGDELIVVRGVDEDVLDRDHNIVREEAREFMRQIQGKSVEYDAERKLSLILEYIPGKITDTLDRLIALYRPDALVVGTRGRRTWQAIGTLGLGGLGGLGGSVGSVGSVSKYCLSHSPVPVIVVTPERKLRKAMEKRRADPKRGRHFEE